MQLFWEINLILIFFSTLLMILIISISHIIIKSKVNSNIPVSNERYYSPQWLAMLFYILSYINTIIFFGTAFLIPKQSDLDAYVIYLLLPVFFITQMHYVINLRAKNFFFYFGDDYLEYFIGLSGEAFNPNKVLYSDIAAVQNTKNRIILILNTGKKLSLLKIQLATLEGNKHLIAQLESANFLDIKNEQ